mgnify:CR=1 FL=1
MDYSLILGVMARPVGPDGRAPAFPPGGHPGQPYVVVTGPRPAPRPAARPAAPRRARFPRAPRWSRDHIGHVATLVTLRSAHGARGGAGKTARAYYLGIIDFLQGWTAGKKVAHVIKFLFAPKPISTVRPKPYADQFWAAQQRRFHALASAAPAGGNPPPPPLVLSGHAASLTPYLSDTPRPSRRQAAPGQRGSAGCGAGGRSVLRLKGVRGGGGGGQAAGGGTRGRAQGSTV